MVRYLFYTIGDLTYQSPLVHTYVYVWHYYYYYYYYLNGLFN